MAKRKASPSSKPIPPPARTVEGREAQLISAAFDLAERRIHEGTASAQEVVHFLKLGTSKEKLEREKITNENKLLKARVKDMESRRTSEELYSKALAAFKGYAGIEVEEEYDEDFDIF